MRKIILLLSILIIPLFAITPLANYQMDECSWNGTAGEVQDSSGNNHNATAINGVTTESNTTEGGGLCHVGKFDGSNDYVDAGNVLNPNSDTWSLSVWIKWNGKSGENIIYNKENLYEARVNNGYFQYAWQPHWNWDGGTSTPITANTWTHIVVTYDHNTQKIYKDGNLTYTRSQSGDIGSNTRGARGNTNPHNYFGGDIDELKVFNQALSQNQIQTLYNNEKDKKNYDGSVRVCFGCSSFFDAWDTFRDIHDRHISTKIVAKNFTITIASLDKNNTNLQDFNGTVCAKIDNNITKLDFRNQNKANATFHISKAIKDARVHISWKKDVDETCPLSSEDNSTDSSDNFAIRPLKFTMDFNTSSFYAGVPFHMGIHAINDSGNSSMDYNETNGTSFSFDVNDSNSTCSAGVLGNLPVPFKFSDGNISFDTNYSDVGDVKLNIAEINGSEFAKVDADDTNDSQRLIQSYSKTITVKPYQFAIIDYNFTRSPDRDWRYMSDVSESNISISFKIQSQNKMGDVTKKFDKNCYGDDVGVHIDLNSTSSDGNVSYYELINATAVQNHDRNLSDFDLNDTIQSNSFQAGNSSLIIYALNIYRQFNNPINPLDINVTEINTTNSLSANNIGLKPDNNGSKFYYARLYTKDLSTSKTSDTVQTKVLVYDNNASHDSYVDGLTEELSDWYYYKPQNDSSHGNIIGLNVSKTTTKKSTNDDDINATSSFDENGAFDINVSNPNENTQTHYIHLNVSPWLWYVNKNFGSDYNKSVGSSCSEHPCIKYNYHNANDTDKSGVSSGHINGVNFDVNVSKNSKGIRLLR